MRNLPDLCIKLYRVLLLLGALLLAGQTRDTNAASPSSKVVIKFSHNQQTVTPPHKAAEMFKQAVEQRTNGHYDVQIFPAQQLGGLRDQVEQTVLGTIEVTQQTPAIVSLFVPKVMILDFPFLWPPDQAAMWKVLDGPIGRELLQSLEAKGLKGVDFWSSGFKNFTTSNRPIRSLEDHRGMKMRVIPSPLLSAQYEAWGATPTPSTSKSCTPPCNRVWWTARRTRREPLSTRSSTRCRNI